MRASLSAALTGALFLFFSAGAGAVPVSSNPTINNGDLTFDRFACHLTSGGTFSTPSRCGKVDVSANLTPAGGLDITSSFVATPFSFDDTLLSFHVHANQGPITAIELDFDGFFMGLAIASVTETAKDVHGNVVGFLNVSCSNLGCDRQDPAYERFDIPLNGAYTDLYITKDINVTAAGGFAGASYVHQGYVTATQVPEPGSMALLGAGVLGLVLFSPRRGAARARSRRGSSVRL